MTCSGSGRFTCNVCGAACERPVDAPGRESAHCPACGASMRVRALVALLSTEVFGIAMALPEFPGLKSLRAIGMSDSPELARRLGEKFDYTNTFYHEAPFFDVTDPDEADFGRYDFILTSEVMEHVPPPVERAFGHLFRLLKPDGLLLMTTPYTLEGKTAEHFPELHEYTLASPGGRTVLVNRRRDGGIEVFENLMFHGGPGSTLEMRVFSEESLRQTLAGAGFASVRIASEDFPDFGVEHAETWSLPIAARKGRFVAPPAEVARAYREACRRATRLEADRDAIQADYHRHLEFHNRSHQEMKEALEERTEWARGIERELEGRTAWAHDLERETNEAVAAFERVSQSEREAWERIRTLEKELEEARALQARLWTRLGRRLGAVP